MKLIIFEEDLKNCFSTAAFGKALDAVVSRNKNF